MPDSVTAVAVKVVYLARLREALGTTGESIVVPDSVRNIGELRRWLAARGGVFAAELGPGRAVRIAVNHEMASADAPIRAGDEIALFPPVTGG